MDKPVIQHIRGTSAQWIEINPILYEGELGLETDTRKFKFGDGVHTWNELEYANATADEIPDVVLPTEFSGGDASYINYNNAKNKNEVCVYITTAVDDVYTQDIVDMQFEAITTNETDTVVWSVSDDNNYATITEDGKLSCANNADIIVTATSTLDNSKKDIKIIKLSK